MIEDCMHNSLTTDHQTYLKSEVRKNNRVILYISFSIASTTTMTSVTEFAITGGSLSSILFESEDEELAVMVLREGTIYIIYKLAFCHKKQSNIIAYL